jgi:iron complex transport system substrate-binding protein
MRIVTLLPAATEIVALLAPESLVGVSHECDHPAWIGGLPRVTTTPIDPMAPSAVIDAQVRAAMEAGRPVIAVDGESLRRLRPDLIVTQGLCEVCAVADGQVHRLADALDPKPRVLSLGARTIEGIFEDIRAVGRAVDEADGARETRGADEAEEVIAGMEYKLERLRERAPLRSLPETDPERSEGKVEGPAPPRVVVIEWLDPLFLAGHWTPELVEAAGGLDVGARRGEHSRRRAWREIADLAPDIILVALCGFSVERAREEWGTRLPPEARAALRPLLSSAHAPVRSLFTDGNQYTSRPGPRVVEAFDEVVEAADEVVSIQ